MADNNGKSRADELFDMLNELNSETPEQKVSKDRQEIDSHVDEILEILSKNEPAPEYKQERNAVYQKVNLRGNHCIDNGNTVGGLVSCLLIDKFNTGAAKLRNQSILEASPLFYY